TTRTREAQLGMLRAEMTTLGPKAAMRPDYETELEAARDRRGDLQALGQAQETALSGLLNAQKLRDEKALRLTDAEGRLKEAEREAYTLKQQQESIAGRIAGYQKTLEHRER